MAAGYSGGKNTELGQQLGHMQDAVTGVRALRELDRGNLDAAQSLATGMNSAKAAGDKADVISAQQRAQAQEVQSSAQVEADQPAQAQAKVDEQNEEKPAANDRNGSDVESDQRAERNGGVAEPSTSTRLTVGKGQTLEGIARENYGENWRAGLTQMMVDNNIKLNQWGSPVLREGKPLVLNDISGKSEQELAAMGRTGGRVIASNDRGLRAKADLEERVRVAAEQKKQEASRPVSTNEAASTQSAVAATATPDVSVPNVGGENAPVGFVDRMGQLSQKLHVPQGVIKNSYDEATAGMENRNNSWGERAVHTVLATAMLPLAFGEELTRGVLNIPSEAAGAFPKAAEAGKQTAMASDSSLPTDERVIAGLKATQLSAEAFTGLGNVAIGVKAGVEANSTQSVAAANAENAVIPPRTSGGTANAATAPQLAEQLANETLVASGAKMSKIEVTAQGKVNGQVYLDTNQNARSTTAADAAERTLVPAERVAAREEIGRGNVNGNMATAHAEIGVIQQASKAGVAKGSDMTISVTGSRAVCPYCRGDIPLAAEAAGLKSLTVIDTKAGVTLYWTPGMKNMKPR
jgi:hypothetical protein